MGRPRCYANATERQRAYRQKRRAQTAAYTKLALLQEAAASEHVVVCGGRLQLQHTATAEQRKLQQEAKEMAMADALWMLQTLVADFGLEEVHRYVLQYLQRP